MEKNRMTICGESRIAGAFRPPLDATPGTQLSSVKLKLPVCRTKVLQELSPYVGAGIDARDDGIEDSGSTVDDVQRWMKTLLRRLARRDFDRILVGYPARIDAVHVNAIAVKIRRRRPRHHIESGFCHVGMRMARGFPIPVELTFDGGDIDNVFVALRRS